MTKNRIAILAALCATIAVSAPAVASNVVKAYRGTHSFDIVQADQFRPSKHSSTITAATDITLAQLKRASVFLVSTTAPGAATLDIDIGDDAAITSDMIGQEWDFIILTGSSALTVTAGASGFTTVTTQNLLGATCEDPGDRITCQARSTSAVTCYRSCAD